MCLFYHSCTELLPAHSGFYGVRLITFSIHPANPINPGWIQASSVEVKMLYPNLEEQIYC